MKSKKKAYGWLIGTACVVAVFCIGYATWQKPAADILVSGQSNQEPRAEEASAVEDDLVTMISSYVPVKDLDDLMEESTLTVRGTVTGIECLTISSVTGETMKYTEFTVSAEEILRGTTKDREAIRVRRMGDISDDGQIWENEPVLNVGTEYILFLQEPAMGGSFNTEGEFYYFVGMDQGAYQRVAAEETMPVTKGKIANDECFRSLSDLKKDAVDTLNSNEGRQRETQPAMIITKQDLTEKVALVNEESPVDRNAFKNNYIKNLTANLEEGFITQEEYDRYMLELQEYAQIVSRETVV